ncbi:MAG: hypothetical protein FWD77_08365 [Betaproteobacteria bacterium]|nr:hypothetical protein [Betaproteobacteria bacterium]
MLKLVNFSASSKTPPPETALHVDDNIKFLRAIERITDCSAWLTERGYRLIGARVGGVNGPMILIAPHKRALRELDGYQCKWERSIAPHRDIFEAQRCGVRIRWEVPA